MKHMDFQKRISLLLDGELDGFARQELMDHLSECPDCARAYQEMMSLNHSLAATKISLGDNSLADRVKARVSGKPDFGFNTWKFTMLKQVPIWALIVILAIGVGDKAGRTLTEVFNGQDSASNMATLLSDNSESLSDIALNLGMGDGSQ